LGDPTVPTDILDGVTTWFYNGEDTNSSNGSLTVIDQSGGETTIDMAPNSNNADNPFSPTVEVTQICLDNH